MVALIIRKGVVLWWLVLYLKMGTLRNTCGYFGASMKPWSPIGGHNDEASVLGLAGPRSVAYFCGTHRLHNSSFLWFKFRIL